MITQFKQSILLLGSILFITSNISNNIYSQKILFVPSSKDNKLSDLLKYAQEKKNSGLSNEAIRIYSDLLIKSRTNNHEAIEIECLMALAVLHWNKGELRFSDDLYHQALRIALNNRWSLKAAFCKAAIKIYRLYLEGKIFRDNRQYDISKNTFLEAIRLAQNIGSADHEVKCLRQISIIYLYELNLDKFYLTSKVALQISQKYKLLREQANSAFNIGYYFLKTGRYYDSFLMFWEAKNIFHMVGEPEDEDECLHNIALIYHEIGNYEYSMRYLNILLNRNINSSLKSAILNSMGNAMKKSALLHNNRRKLSDALSCYRSALDLSRINNNKFLEIVLLNNLGYYYLQINMLSEALIYFGIVLNDNELDKYIELKSTIIANLGNAYFEMGRYAIAQKYYSEAVNLLRHKEHPAILWEALYGMGRCFEKLDDDTNALLYFMMSIDTIEKLVDNINIENDKDSFLRDKYYVYESAIWILFKGKNINRGESLLEIISIIDKSRSRTLSSALKSMNSKIRFDQINLESTHLNNTAFSNNRFENSNFDVHNLSSYKPYYEYFKKNESTAIIIYFLGNRFSLLLLINKNGVNCHELPKKEILERKIANFINLLSSNPDDIFQGKNAALRLCNDIFIPNSDKYLAGINNVIIIPDGLLSYLPFESLAIQANDKNELIYLVERFCISYAPSLSCYFFLDGKINTNDNKKVLLIGKSNYSEYSKPGRNDFILAMQSKFVENGFKLNPLLYVKKEIAQICKILNKEKCTVLLNNSADEEIIAKLNLRDFCILHFACHSIVDEEYPSRSALLLTRKNESKEDGYLQSNEILDLDIRADLVVLSACQTGRGKVSRGEGIMGLSKAFYYAGARSVISSLWNVNDFSTAIFMKQFYSFLSKGKTKGEALRSTKIQMIKSEYSHPFYWAAFILNGDFKSCFKMNDY